MGSNKILLYAMFGVIAYVVLVKNKPTESRITNNARGGSQNVAPQDTVGQIAGAVKSIFDTIGSIAQTNQSTT